MRTLQWWLLGLGLALVSPAVYPLSGSVVASDNVKARLISETDAIAPGQSIWVALEFDHSGRLAYVLAQPRGFGPGHQAQVDIARRCDGGRHRLDGPASLRNSPAGQLRLRQTRDAHGADHGGAGPQDRRRARAAGQGELAGVRRCMHPRECRPAVAAAGEARGRRHRPRGRPAVRRGAQRAADRAAGRDRREDPPRPAGADPRQRMGRDAVADSVAGVLSV